MNSETASSEGNRIFKLYEPLPQEVKDFIETLIRSIFKLERELKKGQKNND